MCVEQMRAGHKMVDHKEAENDLIIAVTIGPCGKFDFENGLDVGVWVGNFVEISKRSSDDSSSPDCMCLKMGHCWA